MKKTRRILGLLITAVMLLNVVNVGFAYSGSLGENLYNSYIDIGEKTQLANGVYWNANYSEKITENYIEYTPKESVKPIISHGNDIYGAASFRAVVEKAKTEGHHVIAGLNGDFFDMSTGVPLGITIKNKLLLNSESIRRPALGIYPDGSLLIGRPNVKISASGNTIGSGFTSLNYNKAITDSTGVVLYTRVFSNDNTNKAKVPTYNVLLKVDRDEIKINDYIEGTVVEGHESRGATFIPPGHVLLSITLSTQYTGSLSRLMSANHGDIISFKTESDPAWHDVEYAIGTGDKLIEKGQILPPVDREIHPRTAVGIKADGSAVFYTVDGRQTNHSKGVTLKELSERMLELGCVEAVNMDGGGSTAIHGMYPGEGGLDLINQPSQSSLRNCANYILLVNTAKPTGSISNLHIYPYSARILSGSEIKFQVKASDDNYYSMKVPEQLQFTKSGDIGNFNEDNIFIAGKTKAKGEIRVSSGRASGATDVEVVDRVDKITILNEATGKTINSLSIFAGEKIDLKASSIYKRLPLLSSDKAYSWSVSGDVGEIDEEGVFRAADINQGKGKITVGLNGITATLDVNISSEGWLVEDFEGKENFFSENHLVGINMQINEELTKVKYGYKSALLDYDFSQANEEILFMPIAADFAKIPRMMNFYVYGDNSNNSLELQVKTKDGIKILEIGKLDFNGWKQMIIDLPSGTNGMEGISIVATGQDKGRVYLDQFIAGIGYYIDTEAPEITMSINEGILEATIKDDIDTDINSSKIKLTLDGQKLKFQYDEGRGILNAALNIEDNEMHRLALEVTDESGNIGREGLSIKGKPSADEIFNDIENHWAKNNIEYLYNQGVVNGIKTNQGFIFNPNKSITRAEFAVLMKNWIGKKADVYTNIELPFIDKSTIPEWALDSVKAMYGMGIVAGTGTNKGVVFNPSGPISRQEVMTIIGRTQARGYGEAELSTFVDSEDVAEWAEPYVKTLVKQEVVSGSGGKLRPKNSITRAEVVTIITSLN